MSEIDVTQCENYKLGFSGYICADPNLRNDCSLNNNCKFKQLARKTQECAGLKDELHSKVEYIQEQREIINEYSKEIELYKKCQGKRASKREEELKAENKELKEKYHKLQKQLDQLKVEKAKLEAQIEADTQYYIEEECNIRKIIRNKEKRNVELYKENNQLKVAKEQAEQKLERIRELAIVLKNICPHITMEGNDSERAIDEILQIIEEVE